MFNLDAPIIPGKSAGGCSIGQSIAEIVGEDGEALHRASVFDYRGYPAEMDVYRSDAIDLWVTAAGRIDLIGVHGSYRGKLLNVIGLGMTIDDIERLIGLCGEDEEDTLIIQGIRGLSFDVAWRPEKRLEVIDFQARAFRYSPLTWFWIYGENT